MCAAGLKSSADSQGHQPVDWMGRDSHATTSAISRSGSSDRSPIVPRSERATARLDGSGAVAEVSDSTRTRRAIRAACVENGW